MDLFRMAVKIAESGLVVHENYDKNELYVARPASLKGTEFRGWTEDDVSGISDTVLKINAPTGKIRISNKKKRLIFEVEISMGAAPGPGPEWFKDVFHSEDEAVEAIIDCYFSDRIDFSNTSLNSWFD